MHAHRLGAECDAASSTPRHKAANVASVVRELLSNEKADRKAAAVAQAASFESAGLPFVMGPDGHIMIKI